MDEYAKGLRSLYLDKVRGILTEKDFLDMSGEFTAEKERLETLIAAGEQQLSELDERISAGDDRRNLIERYTNPEHLTREMVEVLIDYISVGKRTPGEKDPPVEIHWNF